MGKNETVFSNKIRQIRKAKNITLEALAEQTGISPSYLSRMEGGKRNVSLQNLNIVAAALRVTVRDLVPDAPPQPGLSSKEQSQIERLVRQPPPEVGKQDVDLSRPVAVPPLQGLSGLRDVPVRGTAVGGTEGDGDFRFNGEEIDRLPRPAALAHRKDIYGLYVENDSMFPRYEPGDPLYVDPHRTAQIGDDVVIELHGGSGDEPGPGYVKQLVRRTPTKIVVKQFNPEREIEFERAQVKTIHRVIPRRELLGL